MWQENLKQLQAQHPERKTKGHYDSTAFFEAGWWWWLVRRGRGGVSL